MKVENTPKAYAKILANLASRQANPNELKLQIETHGISKIFRTLIYCSVFFIYYILFLNQGLQHTGPLGGFMSETYNHMMFSRPFLQNNWLPVFKWNFEPLLHILTASLARLLKLISKNNETMNLANAAAFILSSAKLAQFLIVKKIIKETSNLNEATTLFLTITINLCTVLYLPFITLNIYIPMLTPNMLADPTNILLAPVAILFFYYYFKHYVKLDAVSLNKSISLSLLLIAATLIKPAFINVILVVIGIYYLFNPNRFASKNLLHDIIIFLPSCLILIWQIYLISNSVASGGMIEFAPYKVIRYYSKHPIISLFQAIEFPLLITTVCYFKTKRLNLHLCFAWIFCVIAYLIYALFSLSGPTWTAANLAWSYQIGLTLLYIFSMIEYGKLFSSQDTQIGNFMENFCAINFSLIFLSGVHQFIKVFLGGSFL